MGQGFVVFRKISIINEDSQKISLSPVYQEPLL